MRYLILDTETGGFQKEASLLSAYFGVIENGELTDELDLKLCPNDGIYNVHREALQVNKIDLLTWDAISYKEGGKLLRQFLFDYYSQNGEWLIPLGQNVGGDIDKITSTIIDLSGWEQKVSSNYLDTLRIATFLRDCGKLSLPSLSLKSLIEYFNIKVEGELHTARYDALATYEVYLKLKELS